MCIRTTIFVRLLVGDCVQFDPIRKHLKNDTNTNTNGLDDGLNRQVNALPYSITRRYGEIVFAQGGTGYGWWPCQIYDPRLAIDPSVRQTAQKHLHTRLLVYFFNCTDIKLDSSTAKGGTSAIPTNSTNNPNSNHSTSTSATGTATPFSILAPKMIKSWIVGLSDDLYFGRAAKNHGKQRYRSFCDAFQLACIEFDKTINNTLIDQQHRYILNEYVYPKTNMNSDRTIAVSNTTTTSIISPTQEKKIRQKSFLLPSPRNKDAVDQKIKVSNNKTKQKDSKKRGRIETIDWIRIPCPSRKRHRPNCKSAPIQNLSTGTFDNDNNYDDDDDDDIPHPAFADIVLANYTITVSSTCFDDDGRNTFSYIRNDSDVESGFQTSIPAKGGKKRTNAADATRQFESSSSEALPQRDDRLHSADLVEADSLTKKKRGRPKKLGQRQDTGY